MGSNSPLDFDPLQILLLSHPHTIEGFLQLVLDSIFPRNLHVHTLMNSNRCLFIGFSDPQSRDLFLLLSISPYTERKNAISYS